MRRTLLIVLALLAPPVAVMVADGLTRWPKRFAEILPDSLYRGAYPTAAQVDRLAHELHVRTILNLTGDQGDERERQARDAAAARDVAVVSLPLPGDGRADFDILDQAAAVLADDARRPLFFHCAAGKQRSNVVLAAYRIKHCGWSLQRVFEELDAHGLDREEEKPLCDHIRAYFDRLHGAAGTTTQDAASPSPDASRQAPRTRPAG